MLRLEEEKMLSIKEEIKTDLEEIISRLEETRYSALDMRESNEMGLQSRDYEADYDEHYEKNYEEDVESLESAIFELQSFIDGIIQFVGEEIENLRSLVEKVDRTD
jgi:hypothetical protein